MKTLVTGGAGFVGSNLVKKLIADKHDVTVLDNLSTGKLSNLKELSNHKFVLGDVRDFDLIPDFDVIFHLGALARIQPSFARPKEVFEVNAYGTLNVLEYARQSSCKVIYAGSSSFYYDIYANPYAYTKWIGEENCKLYNKIYGVPTAIARFFNVYGPHQVEDGPYSTLVGIFEKQKREGKPLTVTGDGLQRRDFTHVMDIVNGLIAMANHDYFNADIFNFGTGKNYAVLEVAKMFNAPIEFIPRRPGEAQNTLADITKAKNDLGYEPKGNIEEYVRTKFEQ